MTAALKPRALAGDIADDTSAITVDAHDSGQWSVWDDTDRWWGLVDATVLDELAGHFSLYGVEVHRRHDGAAWVAGLSTVPAPLVKIAHDGLQLATAAVTDLPDGALGVCLAAELSTSQTVNALLFWLEKITVHDTIYNAQPDTAGFVRLNIRGTLPDGTRLVVVGLFHVDTAPNAVRIIGGEIGRQDVRSLLTHLAICAGRKACSH
uniref:hypothetical protein n=1 Tax=Amycolatopsis sp. CA-293810 TaxID=3239926 RepID=UPI003F4940DE